MICLSSNQMPNLYHTKYSLLKLASRACFMQWGHLKRTFLLLPLKHLFA